MAKILIVDDEGNIRLMLRLALRAEGHETASASDGPEALELFGAGEFDLVLLDQRMPGMDGLEVLRAMRSQNAGARVVMATAFGTVDLAREAMRAGAVGFLRKPFATETLRSAVAAALSGQTPESPPPTPSHTPSTSVSAAHFDAVSVNGFRLEARGETGAIGHHEFLIHAAGAAPTPCSVEMPPYFIELVKAQSDREDLQKDADFWSWLGEEALANYLWQQAAPPVGGVLVLDELTSNLRRWMDATLAA